jgi:hypothetical protein
MASSSILITCPDCKKQLKGPAEILGKKVRCKSCGHIFVVKSTPPAAPGTAAPQALPAKAQPTPSAEDEKQTYDFAKSYVAVPPPKASPAPAPIKSKTSPSPHADDDKTPYTMTDVIQTARRCPQCAVEMEEGAVVCLDCGYNTETRVRLSTIQTYETTGGEWMAWLLPGILCALGSLLALGLIAFLWLGIRRPQEGESSWWQFPTQVWGSVICAGIAWITGKFAYKRLVLNPNPPEKIKRR